VIERSLAWLVGYRRVQVRYERRADLLLGLVYLACALICLKRTFRPQMSDRESVHFGPVRVLEPALCDPS
jgi:hypothetical protein